MKQLLQSLKDGRTEVADIPCPSAAAGRLLIRTRRTLVSSGTERMVVEFGKAGWLAKARQQPEKVRMVIDKVRADGIAPTLQAVRSKLEQPVPLGYCNAGVVVEMGPGVTGFEPGDRVASNGPHAEMVAVPVNLCARIPDAVSDDEAAFTVAGAIALQGIRLVQPALGEAVVVTGLGLIGLLTVQLLRANGCRVLGIDYDPDKLALAAQFGAETVDLSAGADPIAAAGRFSRGRGIDAVIIAASTDSDKPMREAAAMCRQRGRIVLVGVTGLNLSRADFYAKELTFQVSYSFGPGRHDARYEEKGLDYPVGFVRWTEQRNFEAVLDMMGSGRLDVKPLISHRFPIAEVAKAYDLVAGGEPSTAILLEYPASPDEGPAPRRETIATSAPRPRSGRPSIGFVGAGNYATGMLIPAFREAGAHLAAIASSGGVSGAHAARRFGFDRTTTDIEAVIEDPEIDAVVIATRHDSHARLVCRALDAGKHVFVEKPLALTAAEIDEIESARERRLAAGNAPVLTVGFNRRFAPHVAKMKALLAGAPGPKALIMTVNAGAIPPDHWTQDAETGGGRIIGEGCHFVDLLRFLADSPIVAQHSAFLAAATGDTATIQLEFADGSIGTVHYLANGSKRFPKERLELFAAGRVLQLDNFRRLTGFGWPGFSGMRTFRQDKGQSALAAAFLAAVEGRAPDPIPFDQLIEVGRVTIAAAQAGEHRWGA